MANYDDMAFNALESDNDAYVTGGAITVSEYEQNMTPTDQKSYEDTLMRSFQTSFGRDPYKRGLDFNHWLNTLDPELVRERAGRWEDIKASSGGIGRMQNMDPREAALLEDSGLLQKLAHLHTGRIEDIVEIVRSIAPENQPQPQQPQQQPQPQLQPQPQQDPSGQY